jgi:hypothetical protein
MNIFYLHNDPKTCAEMHVDKHVTKMIIEYAQLMSTAHRVLDGVQDIEKRYVQGSLPARWRHIKIWNHPDTEYNTGLMRASHVNHPSGVWCRANKENYHWLYSLWMYLLEEYTYRYGKIHACEKYKLYLMFFPKNIPDGEFYPPTPAMPDDCKIGDVLLSYRKYYIDYKHGFAKWKNRERPDWYVHNS